jgi:CubicO group peptidase (beta-lactamase class C family)
LLALLLLALGHIASAQQLPQDRSAADVAGTWMNFGYCLLGWVIEQITGQPYSGYVQSAVLAPCGISGMRIAGNTLRERAPNEVVYFGQPMQALRTE